MTTPSETRCKALPDVDPTFLAQVREFIGKGADRPGFIAPTPVSAAVIKQMTEAVGDRNPVYKDEAIARRSPLHGGLVAPPLWLQSWSMPGLDPEPDELLPDGTRYFHCAARGQRRTQFDNPTIRDELNALLDSQGFNAPIVTNTSYTVERYLRPGERPRFSSWIVEDVVGPKFTKLGTGFFASMRADVFVGEEKVSSIAQRYLRYKPFDHEPDADAKPATSVSAASRELPLPTLKPFHSDNEAMVRFDSVRVGDVLPDLVVRLSPTFVISGALASQDFTDVHHDYPMMGTRGHPTIFMNTITASGLIGRYVTDWTGPDAAVRFHDLQLGRPNYAGDTLRLTGMVRAAKSVEGRRLVTVAITGHNGFGKCMDSRVIVQLAN